MCWNFHGFWLHIGRRSLFGAACTVSGPAFALTIGFTSGELEDLPALAQDAAAEAALRAAAPLSADADVTILLRFEEFDPGSTILASATSYRSDYAYATVRQALAPGLGPAADALLQPGLGFTYLASGDGTLGTSPTLSVNSATAKQLGLVSNVASRVDGEVVFNADKTFDFDPEDGIDTGAYDFVGVLMHEIGQILGFRSSTSLLDQGLPRQESPTLQDLFRFSDLSLATGAALGIDYMPDVSADAREKYFLATTGAEGDLFDAIPYSTGALGDGGQPSHWKAGLDLGLMDPFFYRGEERAGWSANDLLFFDAIGYDLCCAQAPIGDATAVPLPAAAWLLLLCVATLGALGPLRAARVIPGWSRQEVIRAGRRRPLPTPVPACRTSRPSELRSG
jgi:hypothetical protein